MRKAQQKEVAGERVEQRWRRSEEHTSELQSPCNLVCRLLLEKKQHPSHVSLRYIPGDQGSNRRHALRRHHRDTPPPRSPPARFLQRSPTGRSPPANNLQ